MAVLLDSGYLLGSLNSTEAEHLSNNRSTGEKSRTDHSADPGNHRGAYLLARDIGNGVAANSISSLADTDLIVEAPVAEDYLRSAEILRQYADAHLDFVDALIAATAERVNIKQRLTLDRRDLQLIRPKHCDSFELLP
jgi:uncharacterized protein